MKNKNESRNFGAHYGGNLAIIKMIVGYGVNTAYSPTLMLNYSEISRKETYLSSCFISFAWSSAMLIRKYVVGAVRSRFFLELFCMACTIGVKTVLIDNT